MKNFYLLKKRIKKNEGFKNVAYKDILGNFTIGYGHLIKKNEKFLLKGKFSKEYLKRVFDLDFKKTLLDYNQYYKKKYSKNVQNVLLEMIFQLGIKKQKKFIKMQNHIDNNNLYMAALEMKNSLWYEQTPKRVNKLIDILLKQL